MDALTIYDENETVTKYLDDVKSAADSNKNSLGFLPASVFARYAGKGNLWVAVNAAGVYVGHLLFDLRYPRATIIQMYSAPASRRTGVASAMISRLKSTLAEKEYLSIRASVASDLKSANNFWQDQGFIIQSRKIGGKTTGRHILVRVHELDVPQLFSRSGLGFRKEETLGLAHVASPAPSLYLLDLNIVFDLAKRRAEHEAAAALFRAAHAGECRIAISDEMRRELHRSAVSPETDPMLCLIDSLPCVQLPESRDTETILVGVAKLIFPEKKYPDQLSVNDMSDIRHVSTAILCQLAGFITRDHRILRAAGDLEFEYGIQIFAPHDFDASNLGFGQMLELDINDERISVAPYETKNYDQVREILDEYSVPPAEIVGSWMRPDSQEYMRASLVATVSGQVVGYIASSSFEPKTKHAKLLAIVKDGDDRAPHIARLLLNKAMELDTKSPAMLFQLYMPERQSCLREAAHALGFRADQSQRVLLKVSFRRVVTSENWSDSKRALSNSADLRIVGDAPDWISHKSEIGVICPDGNQRFIRVDVLETLISPAIFALSGRPSLIVPIQPKYSEDLLGNSRQLSLAPRMQLESAKSRKYFADSRSLSSYTKGGLVLFYESGASGEKAIVAVGRIVDAYLACLDNVGEELLSGSVLTKESILGIGVSERKACCVFDNLIILDRPVRLSFLRSVGIDSSRLITALKISDFQLARILKEGFNEV